LRLRLRKLPPGDKPAAQDCQEEKCGNAPEPRRTTEVNREKSRFEHQKRNGLDRCLHDHTIFRTRFPALGRRGFTTASGTRHCSRRRVRAFFRARQATPTADGCDRQPCNAIVVAAQPAQPGRVRTGNAHYCRTVGDNVGVVAALGVVGKEKGSGVFSASSWNRPCARAESPGIHRRRDEKTPDLFVPRI